MNDISFSPSTNDLLHADPRNIAKLQVELTSDCNLRCTYCTLSQPWYEGRHMEDSNIHKVIEFTKRHNIQSVHLNGHGESTIAPRWTEIAQEFLKSGFHLTITTNLAKKYTSDEIETLAQFEQLDISLETIDLKTLQQLRRKADIRQILHNIHMIRARALELGCPTPRIVWGSIIAAETVEHFPKLVAMAIECRINHWHIQSLTKMDEIEGALNLNPILSLEGEVFLEAVQHLNEALSLARKHQLSFHFQGSMAEDLMAKAREILTSRQSQASCRPGGPKAITKSVIKADDSCMPADAILYGSGTPKGYTRDCTDPWSFMMLESNQQVSCCCFGQKPLGTLKLGQSIEEVFNAPRANNLRNSLLTGELDSICANCSYRTLVPVDKFHKKISHEFKVTTSLNGNAHAN